MGSHDLLTQLKDLTTEVRDLKERVARLEAGRPSLTRPSAAPGEKIQQEAVEKEGKGVRSVGGMAVLLSRATAITLVLLLALVLRTLTDSGVVGLTVGSVVGIAYASLLEGAGFILYRRKSPYAPIFSVSGALLLFAVVLETHSGFGAITSIPAYIMLVVAAGGLAVMSRIYRVGLPVTVGTMGILVAGLLIDFPQPNFLFLALFLLAVNVMAFTAVYLPSCRWLRIAGFTATAMAYMGWAYKIYSIRETGQAAAPGLAPNLFIPSITIMSAFYVSYVAWRIVRMENHRPDLVESLLPTLTATWAYWLVRLYVPNEPGTLAVIGGIGTVIAAVLMTLAIFMARYREEGAPGTNTMVFPAAFLLAISFRDLSGESVIALAVLSLVAYLLTYLSDRWKSPGVRVTSYFLQAMVMGASFILLWSGPGGDLPAATIASMAAVTVFAYLHYRRIRRRQPPSPSVFFRRIDRRDLSGVLPLIASLCAAFFMLRAGSHLLFDGPMFKAAESVIINLGAALLFYKAFRTAKIEVRNVAKLVTAIGAGKVFLFDLLSIKGFPVVLSVLSFGIAAAVGSVVLTRWPQVGGDGDEGSPPARSDQS